MFFKKEPDPVIEFKCHPDLEGVIPEPYPARHYMPDWYKKLAMFVRVEDDAPQNDEPTIKRCPPVLDALVTGWIIPLVCQVEFTIKDKGSSVSWILNKGDSNKPASFAVQNHNQNQVKGHPMNPRVPLKFINHWHIKTPPGWSCLFVPPLNREEKNIELISGIVDTDIFHEYINFPGFIIPNDIEYLKLEQGYPMMQVIPFRRGFNKDAKISTLSSENISYMEKQRQIRSTRNASLYRDEHWNKK